MYFMAVLLIISVTNFVAPAYIDRNGKHEPVVVAAKLQGNETIGTGSGGRVRLSIPGRGILSLDSNSAVDLLCTDVKACKVKLRRGRLRLQVKAPLQALAPGMSCQLDSGDFTMTTAPKSEITPASSGKYSCESAP